jgi:hypothetical protein
MNSRRLIASSKAQDRGIVAGYTCGGKAAALAGLQLQVGWLGLRTSGHSDLDDLIESETREMGELEFKGALFTDRKSRNNAETGWREADGQVGGRLPMFVGRFWGTPDILLSPALLMRKDSHWGKRKLKRDQ